MGKYKRIITTIMLVVLGASILLYLGQRFITTRISDIPKKNEISSVEVYRNHDYITNYHVVEGDENITQIYNALMSSKKSNAESIDDTPRDAVGDIAKIVLTDKHSNPTTLFVYQSNEGKYYIEKPYGSIYEIPVENYEVLTQYFIAN